MGNNTVFMCTLPPYRLSAQLDVGHGRVAATRVTPPGGSVNTVNTVNNVNPAPGWRHYEGRYFRPPPCLSHRKDFPQPRIMCFRVQMTSPLFTLFPELFSCFYYVFRVQMISVFYFQNVCLSALRLFSCLCSFKRGLKAYLIQ